MIAVVVTTARGFSSRVRVIGFRLLVLGTGGFDVSQALRRRDARRRGESLFDFIGPDAREQAGPPWRGRVQAGLRSLPPGRAGATAEAGAARSAAGWLAGPCIATGAPEAVQPRGDL